MPLRKGRFCTRGFRRAMASVLTAVLLLSMGSTLPVAADRRQELESQLAALEKQEAAIKKNLAAANSDLSSSQYRKNQLDAQIDNVCAQIELLDGQLSTINSNIRKKQAAIQNAQEDIVAKEAAIQDTHEKLGQRLSTIAKKGNVTALQRLMNTENYTDYLLKAKAAACIAERDQTIMDDLEKELVVIRQKKQELEKEKAALAEDKEAVEKLKSQSDSKKKQLDTLFAAAQTEVRNLQSTVSDYSRQLKDKQKEIAAADAAIEALIKSTGSTGSYNNAMMFWPVPTVRALSSTYGPRWGTIHKGIDIANGPIPIYGENIVAAADGVVIAVNKTSKWGYGWSAGYGYCVLIDHGKDSKGRQVNTMYAHCSKVLVSEGQRVVGGKTVIARAGSTGNVTGPHLHFEVRLDGKATDPLNGYVSPHVN